jgi:exodeoxyribonuclease V gamma subunit
MDRLLLGYLMGDCREPLRGILPYPHLTGEANELGAFASLIETLTQWRLRVGRDRPADEWCTDLLRLLADFFDPGGRPGTAHPARGRQQSQSDCRLAGYAVPLSFAVIKEHLETALSNPTAARPFSAEGSLSATWSRCAPSPSASSACWV